MVFQPVGGFVLDSGHHICQKFFFLGGQIGSEESFRAGENAGDSRQQIQRFLGGEELHDPLVGGGWDSGDEALFLQNSCLTGHITLVDTNNGGQLILRNTGVGANFRQVTGVAGF